MRSGPFGSGLLAVLLLLSMIPAGAVDQKDANASPPPASQFNTLAATADVTVTRGTVTLPANKVPFLRAGDVVSLSFPKAMQYSTSPRWHLLAAKMYDDYVAKTPSYLIWDADLSRAKPGTVWKVKDDGTGTLVFFLVPENGNRSGRGVREAHGAIDTLENREALMKSALFSESAKAKASTLDDFMHSLTQVSGGEYVDGRERVTSAAQSLFGYDLGNAPCFTTDIPQSDQYACAAQAVATSYQTPTTVSVTTALGNQLSVETATYGMLIGAIYSLLAKNRVNANYIFTPGAFNPNASKTNVYAQQRLQYDPAAEKPSSVVYFQVGSQRVNAKDPSFGSVPSLPVCMSDTTFNAEVPFTGLPVYFRDHNVAFTAGSNSFTVPADYDSVKGYTAKVSDQQLQQLAGGGHATIASTWGFDTFTTAQIGIVHAHPVAWTLDKKSDAMVQGQKAVHLSFTEPDNGIGSCVASVSVTDGLGHPVPVVSMNRSQNAVDVTVDAAQAKGSIGKAVVTEDGNIAGKDIPVPMVPALPVITNATALLPKGVLVLHGSNLKYIDKVALENTNIVFGNGKPDTRDNSRWEFTALGPTSYNPEWVHQTMAISYTLQAPDTRKDAAEANVEYAASPPPVTPAPTPTLAMPAPTPSPHESPTPVPHASPTPMPRASSTLIPDVTPTSTPSAKPT